MNLENIVSLYVTNVVLIDTWWNVNVIPKTFAKIFDEVLIDTWWNVNTPEQVLKVNPQPVLIDTWWNVNVR